MKSNKQHAQKHDSFCLVRTREGETVFCFEDMGAFRINGFSLFARYYMKHLEKLGGTFKTFAEIILLASDKWEVKKIFKRKNIPALSFLELFKRRKSLMERESGTIPQNAGIQQIEKTAQA